MYILISIPVTASFFNSIENEPNVCVRNLLRKIGIEPAMVEQLMPGFTSYGDDISFGIEAPHGLTLEHMHLARDFQLALSGDAPKVGGVIEENVEIRVWASRADMYDIPILTLRYLDQGKRDGYSQTCWMVPDDEEDY